ncbi:hypothetical protein HPB50_004224 [Hyalomma asiaticum]|uniref:Uncharacterized protein n=1 Tax=Hyalomma asiaticum TaxID=266040 RepID=A0ACB7RK10_HYAAI|nr:hypothetical protein HPB50_004224 [Hyalomma asiaticum]
MNGIYTLREKLARLDLARECSHLASEDSCWLCDDLENWNAVLNPLHLHLSERTLGKLQLCTRERTVAEGPQKDVDIEYDAAYFTAWLPRKHGCIDTICITGHHPHPRLFILPETSGEQWASKLRHIFIEGDASYDWALLLDNIGPVSSLETFELRGVCVSDSFGTKAGELLSANRASVETVALSETTITGAASEAVVSGISKCKNLRKLVFSPNLNTSAVRSLAKLVRLTKTLETLHLQSEHASQMHSSESRYRINELEMSLAVAALLKQNTFLVELRYQASKQPIINILMAVEASDTLKHLAIIGDNYKVNYFEEDLADFLKTVLLKNQSLRSLKLESFKILRDASMHLLKGLQGNTTLETFDLSQCCMDVAEVQYICSALRQNSTLHTLTIKAHSGSNSDRLALYEYLDRNMWYGRVHFPYIDVVTRGLVVSVSDPAVSPTDIHLVVDKDTGALFTDLCRALSMSLSVKCLSITFNDAPHQHLPSLLTMFEENRSLQSVTLHESFLDISCAVMVAQGLIVNESVVELSLECRDLSVMSAELISLLLESNEVLYKFSLSSSPELQPELLNSLSHGLAENKFITEVHMDCVTPSMTVAVQRNLTCLHRAIRFVLRRNAGRRYAESFELLESKPSLLLGLQSAAGMTESEAKRAIKVARHYLCTNYLFINSIVCHKLECYPEKRTQIDQLSPDCWVAIVKHLRVCDVVSVDNC